MRRIILILILIISVFFRAQRVYPLGTKLEDRPNGAYFKDVNGELTPYIGVWKGDWDGKVVILEFRKYKRRIGNNKSYLYHDMILGERKIIGVDGKVEMDRIIDFDKECPEFRGVSRYPRDPGRKYISFYPKDMCNKTARLDVVFVDEKKTKMRLILKYNSNFYFEDCRHSEYIEKNNDYPINFPKDIVLTKQ